jgi:Ca2+-binding EF-hand superfamily protein
MDMDSTNDYLRLVADSSWLNNDQDGGRSPVDPYVAERRSPNRKQVHKQPWRFYPNKPKTFTEIGSEKSVERTMAERLLLTELQQRHQDQLEGRLTKPRRRRRGPRTLQPMPKMPRGHQTSKYRNNNAFSSPHQLRSKIFQYEDNAIDGLGGGDGQYNEYGGGGRGNPYAGGRNNMSPTNAMNTMGNIGSISNNQGPLSGTFNDQSDYYRWKEEQGTVVGAVTKQLNRYKTECKRLRKQKRATLYVLRLLEQKILELSGSNATAARIDPQAPGYEMHPEVYKILKEGRTVTKGCRGIQTGSDEFDIVEDYALERSAHELGLKLVRDAATKKLNEEEDAEIKEIRQHQAEAAEAAKLAAEEAAIKEKENAIAEAEAAALAKKGKQSEEGKEKTEATVDVASAENSGTNSEEVLPENNTSLHDTLRQEHLKNKKIKFREMFDRLDIDGSGFLDKSELRKAVFFGDGELGSYINPKKFKKAFDTMDFNSNGEIPYEPFELFLLDCEDASHELILPNETSNNNLVNSNKNKPKMLGESRAEWTEEKLRTIFDRLDSNGNGTLERVEILKAAYSDKDLANFITPSRASQAYTSMSNGQPVNFEKFKSFCRKASSAKLVSLQADSNEREYFKAMFDRLDTNGNGSLERMELYKASHMDHELGQYVSPKQCSSAFKRMDMHNNGKITFDSFLAFCMDVRASK